MILINSLSRSGALAATLALICLSFAGNATAAASPVVSPGADRTVSAPIDPGLRLETIGYRLSQANARLCAVPEVLTGLMLHNLGGYDRTDRADVAASYNLTYGFGVLQVVPGSVGAQAGLIAGDEIVALNGVDLVGYAQDLIGKRGSYARTERFVGLLGSALSQGPAVLRIRRDGSQMNLELHAEKGCGGHFAVLHDRSLNAWSDGRYVAITDRMMGFASDDAELAFVVAHEMAHNILHHADQTKGISRLFAQFGFGAGKLKATEIEADSLAIELMARAGYNLAAPVQLLERLAKGRWFDLPITHPSLSSRIQTIKAASARQPQL